MARRRGTQTKNIKNTNFFFSCYQKKITVDLHQIFTGDETKNLEVTIEKAVLSLKQAYIKSEITKINNELKEKEDPSIQLISKLNKLNRALVVINKLLGRNFN